MSTIWLLVITQLGLMNPMPVYQWKWVPYFSVDFWILITQVKFPRSRYQTRSYSGRPSVLPGSRSPIISFLHREKFQHFHAGNPLPVQTTQRPAALPVMSFPQIPQSPGSPNFNLVQPLQLCLFSSMTARQYAIFAMIMCSSLSSSFTVCLFPPFYPRYGSLLQIKFSGLRDGLIFFHRDLFSRLAEMKGATATDYGLIIGTNCLVAFIVTPFIGNHLDSIGVKFAFVTGILGGGACCLLSGFLEFFEPGSTFITMSVLIRLDGSGLTFWLESMIWVGCQCQVGRIGYFELAFVGDLTKILRILHAISNAMTITSTFTYTACEFPTAVAKIFSITRCPDYWLFLSWTVENY